MGILDDLYEQGLITQDVKEEFSERWEVDGADFRHYGNTEAIQDILQDIEELGLGEYAANLYLQFNDSIDYYTQLVLEETGQHVDYNPVSKRWYDTDTGRFVVDPYEYISD